MLYARCEQQHVLHLCLYVYDTAQPAAAAVVAVATCSTTDDGEEVGKCIDSKNCVAPVCNCHG